MELLGDARSC